MSIEQELEIFKENTIEVLPEDELKKKLEKSRVAKTPLRIKFGADPTSTDIHLGHTVVLKKLRKLQDIGHIVVFIIGDFTATIGDPTGRSETRKRLSKEEVFNNAKDYKKQIARILNMDRVELQYNGDWLGEMCLTEMIDLTSRYTVARILERADFKERFENQKDISLVEFLYPLFQGYDSVITRSDIEIGGNDQKFNLLVGRALQKSYNQEMQVIMTMPLLVGTDGVQKMSKSYGNHIGIDEPSSEIFGKIMSISDELMLEYYRLLTNISPGELTLLSNGIKSGDIHPRKAKAELAKRIVSEYYNAEEANAAEADFEKIFKRKETPDLITEEIDWNEDEINLAKLLRTLEMVDSATDARRLITQGAVSINDARVGDTNHTLCFKEEYVIKVGKRKFKKVLINKK
ncbi:tyrosine--tRNA ligase [Candidatus Poribacteria bacterium]|nr:tyrosine--tRNA ligase [Candidatus Poribacteria bacterium]